MNLIKHILLLMLLVSNSAAYTQTLKQTESMHESGKIYVFLAVVLIILTGLFVYLFILDKKIKKLEKEK